MQINEQGRVIHNPENEAETKVPVWPLLLVFNDGSAAEARTIRGAVSLITGSEYFDTEDEQDDWHLRAEAARRYSMDAMMTGIYAVVYDSRQGVIPANMAAEEDDPDYEEDEDEAPAHIRVDSEKLFLYSMMKLGLVHIFEREDSNLLRPDTETVIKSCGRCIYYQQQNEKRLCQVYMCSMKEMDGESCGSFARTGTNILAEYTGGVYIDIVQEYDIDELMSREEEKLK